MRALFDVSMLIASFDAGHVRHRSAMSWWMQNGASGWATCPLSENGFLRIITQRTYQRPVQLPDALLTLRRQIAEGGHEFWPDDLSLLDGAHIDHGRLLGPKQITDVYLLALAVKNGGRLVTLDTGISVAVVKGATYNNLVAI